MKFIKNMFSGLFTIIVVILFIAIFIIIQNPFSSYDTFLELTSEDFNEKEVTSMIHSYTNEVRYEVGKQPLGRNKKLDAVGKIHSENMALYGYVGHKDSFGKYPVDRLKDNNLYYSCPKSGENVHEHTYEADIEGCGKIYTNEDSAKCAVISFKNSPLHYENMIADFNQLGIGVAIKNNKVYVTQVFCKTDLEQSDCPSGSTYENGQCIIYDDKLDFNDKPTFKYP